MNLNLTPNSMPPLIRARKTIIISQVLFHAPSHYSHLRVELQMLAYGGWVTYPTSEYQLCWEGSTLGFLLPHPYIVHNCGKE